MYLWTARGPDAAAFRKASGVSDDQSRARQAAELLLRTGEAATAYVECAYTAMTAATLNSCYVRTGAGWWAQLGQAGQVVWTPFAGTAGER
jgi:PhoPQ-activated pathogenicity-related protein